MVDPLSETIARATRRQLFGSAGQGIGLVALASLLGRHAQAGADVGPGQAGRAGLPHHTPKAKRMVMPPCQSITTRPRPNEW